MGWFNQTFSTKNGVFPTRICPIISVPLTLLSHQPPSSTMGSAFGYPPKKPPDLIRLRSKSFSFLPRKYRALVTLPPMRPHVAMVQRSTLKSHLEDGYIPRNISQKHSCKGPHKSHFGEVQVLNFFNLCFENHRRPPTKIEKGEKRNMRITLQETNISPKNGSLKMIFLFPRWDMLIPWRVYITSINLFGC